jgi:hypothetical protein
MSLNSHPPKEETLIPLIEISGKPESNKDSEQTQKKSQIEDVLVFVNSFSNAFQYRAWAVFLFLNFFLGIHIFTYIFMFLTPNFFNEDNSVRRARLIYLNPRIVRRRSLSAEKPEHSSGVRLDRV